MPAAKLLYTVSGSYSIEKAKFTVQSTDGRTVMQDTILLCDEGKKKAEDQVCSHLVIMRTIEHLCISLCKTIESPRYIKFRSKSQFCDGPSNLRITDLFYGPVCGSISSPKGFLSKSDTHVLSSIKRILRISSKKNILTL